MPSLAEQINQRRLQATLFNRRRPRRLKRRGKLPPQRWPRTVELRYFGALRGILLFAKGMVDARVRPLAKLELAEAARVRESVGAHTDAPVDVNRELDGISDELFRRFNSEDLTALWAADRQGDGRRAAGAADEADQGGDGG